MLSFEFSVFDLVLSVSVIVLIVLFVTTLLKLNPSNENQPSRSEEAFEQEQEQETALPPPQQPAAPVSWQSTEVALSQRTQQTPRLLLSATAEGTSHESLEQIPKPNENKEPYKQPKTTTSAKQISKSSEDRAKECLHHFGYLNELPKNTPIPGECFGCPKIVDCLITRKGK